MPALAAEYLHEEVADLRKLKEKAETAPKSKKKDTPAAPKPPMVTSAPLCHFSLPHLVFGVYKAHLYAHSKAMEFCIRQGAPFVLPKNLS